MKLPARTRQRPGRPCAVPGCAGFVATRSPDGKRTTARARYCEHHSKGGNAGKVGRWRDPPNDGKRADFPQLKQCLASAVSPIKDFPINVIGGQRQPVAKIDPATRAELLETEVGSYTPRPKAERKWTYAEWLAVVTDPDWGENEDDPVVDEVIAACARFKKVAA
jgi:hypothetical protein